MTKARGSTLMDRKGLRKENYNAPTQTAFDDLQFPANTQGSYAFGMNDAGTIVGRFDDEIGVHVSTPI